MKTSKNNETMINPTSGNNSIKPKKPWCLWLSFRNKGKNFTVMFAIPIGRKTAINDAKENKTLVKPISWGVNKNGWTTNKLKKPNKIPKYVIMVFWIPCFWIIPIGFFCIIIWSKRFFIKISMHFNKYRIFKIKHLLCQLVYLLNGFKNLKGAIPFYWVKTVYYEYRIQM